MHTVKRTVLVTGASSGIGRAVARLLLERGHHVIGTSRNCNRFVQRHPNFSCIAMDFAKADDIPQQARDLEKKFPALDAVVFSAGYGQFGSLEEFSFHQIDKLMTVNFIAQAFLTRALLPKLKQKKHCNLIYIGSEAALQGSRKGSIYCASKFALRGFSQALRDECAKTNVRVSLINPGMVQTAFFDKLAFMPGEGNKQSLRAEDIADTVSYILQTDNHVVIDEISINPANKVIQFKKHLPD